MGIVISFLMRILGCTAEELRDMDSVEYKENDVKSQPEK